MNSSSCCLGIDTSNYKTSVAIVSCGGGIICNLQQYLSVKKGERGLRQSDALFQHVMNDVRMHFIVEGNSVTISAGIASFCEGYENTIKLADENLYQAKTTGRNKIYMNGKEIE